MSPVILMLAPCVEKVDVRDSGVGNTNVERAGVVRFRDRDRGGLKAIQILIIRAHIS